MPKRTRVKLLPRRYDPEFEKFFLDHATVDAEGKITVKDWYAHLGFNVTWKGSLISVTYANAVWFLTHGKWPREGYHIDHIDDDPLNNRPDNLQEITAIENQRKRRGRKVYRSYGRGKYGHGLYIYADKRDGRFYVSRNISRGHGEGDLQGVKIALGGYDTLEEAESVVADNVRRIEESGRPDYIPDPVDKKDKRATTAMDVKLGEMRALRKQGLSIKAVADKFGFDSGAVYKRIRDIPVDCRVTKKVGQ